MIEAFSFQSGTEVAGKISFTALILTCFTVSTTILSRTARV
jgi:hypothetical protein